MIDAVLFDLDDTLFDHRASARAALQAVHGRFAATLDFAAFERHHAHYLEEMHLEVLAGRATLDDARRERFRRVFAALGLKLEPQETDRVASAYRDGYKVARRPVTGAEALLRTLRTRARIGVVTNNLLDEQRDKLEVCGLSALIDGLIASEDVGVAKPDARIFTIALERLGVGPDRAVMVGDSWPNDIAGARAAGIPAIWFNPDRLPQPADPSGVAQLESLQPAEAIAGRILRA